MNRVCSQWIFVLAIVFVLLSPAVFAQSDAGSIVGFVKDPSGSVVPGAKVVAKNEATGIDRTVNTNDSGYYVVSNVPPGFYAITVEANGFKKFEITHNKLDPSSTLSIDASLTVGTATETVEVSGNVQTLRT